MRNSKMNFSTYLPRVDWKLRQNGVKISEEVLLEASLQ
jgi:hypothetical protein